MGIKLALEADDLKKLQKNIRVLHDREIAKAVRQGLNKTAPFMRKITQKRIGLQLNLKKKDSKKKMKVFKAFGSDISRMSAGVHVQGRPIPLLLFVKGKKDPKSTKGKKVKQRRPITVEVRKGQPKRRKDVFIIKGNRGKNVVVRRQQRKRARPLGGSERAPALPTYTRRPETSGAILRMARKKLGQEIIRSTNLAVIKAFEFS